MAACRPLTELRQDALCSICWEFYKDPVTIDCGHNFCLSCLPKYMEQPHLTIYCPECKQKCNKKNLKPNKRLANMVENIQWLEEVFGHLLVGSHCEEHGEALRLFCDTDETLICLVCKESHEHKEHCVRPIKEAHEDYKDKLYSHMEHLKKELKDLHEWAEEESRKASELKGNIMKQREKILRAFEHLKQFPEQEKQQLLSRLEKEQEEKMKNIQEKLTRLEEQQSAHRDLITELERKCQQPDVDLLKDVKSILGRCSEVKARKPQEDAPGMVMTPQRLRRYAQLLAKLQEPSPLEMEWRYVKCYEGEVTLDPGTAHPQLIVSEDGRSVRHVAQAQDLPDTPQRFTEDYCVLGREGLSSGRHYWEVEVGGSTDWILGVCDESLPRKEGITASPAGGVWAVGLLHGEYWALTSHPTPLTPRAPLRVLGLFLDYEAGRFSVYDARDRALLFTFSGASFPRTLRPLFWIWRPRQLFWTWWSQTELILRILPGAG